MVSLIPYLGLFVRRLRDVGITGKRIAVIVVGNFLFQVVSTLNDTIFLHLLDLEIGVFFFVLTVLPTDYLTKTEEKEYTGFFSE